MIFAQGGLPTQQVIYSGHEDECPGRKTEQLGRFPGHLDIEPMWFMNAAGNRPGRIIDSNSGDKISKFFKLLYEVKVKKDNLSLHSFN